MKKLAPEKLKPKLEEILVLIYKYRFLNRPQIQTLLNHKQRQKIIIWLNFLTKEKYLKRYYSKKFAGNPAFYSLGTLGRRYFKDPKDIVGIQEKLLDRVWQESRYSDQFKKRCMFLGDIYISLLNLTENTKAKLNFYTNTDLAGMRYMIRPEPAAYFSIEDQKGITKRYFLDIFDYFIPKEFLKRVRKHIYYFEKEYWQNNTDKPFPEIILVCPNNASKNFLYKTIKKMVGDKNPGMLFYLSTWDEIRQKGLRKEAIHRVIL